MAQGIGTHVEAVVELHPGIIHQNIKPPKSRLEKTRQRRNVGGLGYVQLQGVGCQALGAQGGGGCVGPALAGPQHHHHALLAELASYFEPQPFISPRDGGHFLGLLFHANLKPWPGQKVGWPLGLKN